MPKSKVIEISWINKVIGMWDCLNSDPSFQRRHFSTESGRHSLHRPTTKEAWLLRSHLESPNKATSKLQIPVEFQVSVNYSRKCPANNLKQWTKMSHFFPAARPVEWNWSHCPLRNSNFENELCPDKAKRSTRVCGACLKVVTQGWPRYLWIWDFGNHY